MDFIKVIAAILIKNGKIEYSYNEEDTRFYMEVLGYEFVGFETLYI